jgi:hypothetical protein
MGKIRDVVMGNSGNQEMEAGAKMDWGLFLSFMSSTFKRSF